jgi:hypothetical protein
MSLIRKVVNESFLLDLAPSSLAKLIARDTAMSTLDALTNHLINKVMKEICMVYMVDSTLSLVAKASFVSQECSLVEKRFSSLSSI